MSAAARKGWCPGALRPMPTGDGLLVRVKPSGGRLTLEAAGALAALAERFGNGKLEISSRANLQLRGFRERDLPIVWQELAALGLIDDNAEVEAVRNIVASPLSDLDPAALCDVAPHVEALEARLSVDPRLWRLSAKFSFAIDGRGAFPLDEVEADVTFRAVRVKGGLGWEVSARGGGEPSVIAFDALAEAARTLALRVSAGEDARGSVNLEASAPATQHSARAVGALALGQHAVLIAAPPLGRIAAAPLAALVEAAGAAGASEMRLMPGRRLALVGASEAGVAGLVAKAAELGFIVDPADPRLRVVACAGKPACASAARDVQEDAIALASLLPGGQGGVWLHVSGCAKGCARAKATALTLVAQADGYDAIFNGRADGAPTAFAADLEAARRLLADGARQA